VIVVLPKALLNTRQTQMCKYLLNIHDIIMLLS